ncbi:hypothetical protein L218DRAFT_1007363 [Marasmius fiardii PR-910]|nr:hypothetical protein L218DRAFT_1007363 [Marasmius fiardii PR-910]
MDRRTLVFYFKPGRLTKDVKLVFTFKPPTELALSTSDNRVAWEIFELKAEPGSNTTGLFTINFPDTLSFTVAQQHGPDGVCHPGLAIEIKPGQSTNLTVVGSKRAWSEPTEISEKHIEAINKTNMYQNIYVGTVINDDDIAIPRPTFRFKVGAGSPVKAKFQPQLMMYGNIGYEKDGLITDGLKDNLIWEVDLTTLQKYSCWKFAEGAQGKYSVTAIHKYTIIPIHGPSGEDEDDPWEDGNEDTVVTSSAYHQLK